MINFVHDSMIFYYTKKTLESSSSVIGFYMDHSGCLQSIERASLYGHYITEHAQAN